MLNRYPLWKYLVICLVLAVGVIYALPNLYPEDPAVQISAASGAEAVDQQDLDRAISALENAGITPKSQELNGSTGLIRLTSNDQQLRAKELVSDTLGDNIIVALNLADATPAWLSSLGASPMKLGLDLRGGVHFQLEVDMDAAVKQRLEVNASAIKEMLREERIRYRGSEVNDGTLSLTFSDGDDLSKSRSLISRDFQDFEFDERDVERGSVLDLKLTATAVKQIQDYAVNQNLTTIRNRVNELGVSEPLVQRQGPNRIVVELPGVQDTAAAKRVLGATANLEFRLEATNDTPASEMESFAFRSQPGRTANIMKDVIISGDSVSSASTSFDESGRPQVNINLDGTGGSIMNRVTRAAIGRNMAVLFIEHKTRTRTTMEDGEKVEKRIPYTEKGLISLATIQSALGNRFRITGLDSPTEAKELSLLLRSGSLAAPIYFVQERTIGPSLGAENIASGILSVELGLLLVVLFMLARYKAFGIVANVALTANLAILIAAMSMLGATLTLPGIAGIVLTLGMAVDANVLIFERIREEMRTKMPLHQAIHTGFERAFTSIVDANITTLLVAVILFSIGSGPVKGFAVTLSIGILTSMFTAIMMSRGIINLAIGGKTLKKLWI